jgi:hypothetical protein
MPRPRTPAGTETEEDAMAAWISHLAISDPSERHATLARGKPNLVLSD